MARRYNELFIGSEFLSEEGRKIKHQGLMSEFGNPTISKISDHELHLVGLDLETNYKTAELKLLGIWNGSHYRSHTSKFLVHLFELVERAFWEGNKGKGLHALAYWNKLDPFVLYKQFLLLFKDEKQIYSMKRYGKIAGEWSSYKGKWKIRPVVEIEITRGNRSYRFGIKNVIRSSIQFFFYEITPSGMPKQLNNGVYPLRQVWAFDIASLFRNGLEKEMTSRSDLFPYYSKVDESAHLVDWDRFNSDQDFRENIVLKSNMYDARAVYDLGKLMVHQFKKAFNYFPRNLISSGSIARAAIVATLTHKYMLQFNNRDVADKMALSEFKSIGIMHYYDIWQEEMDETDLKDMFCLFYEAYSGGYIETFAYGLIKKGFYSDIAAAYIKWITELQDLRNSIVTTGSGEPPHIENSYCVIRGIITIPLGCNYFPLTVKDITNKDTNVRVAGTYKGSYYIEERDYLTSLGATFKEETWYNIETKGALSPIAVVASDFWDKRQEAIAANDSVEYMYKTSAASLYGVTFEATETFKESDQLEIFREGYRGGELLNPLFAGWVTMKTRTQLSMACNNIADNGGVPVMVMTDCVFAEGDPSTLDPEFIKEIKTLGYFEKPVEFEKMALLGTGRYSFIDSKKGYVTTKNRGLNITEIHDPDGITVGMYNWIEALQLAERDNTFKIDVKVRKLVSVGMILHNSAYTVLDLGKVVEETATVDLVTGQSKRIIDEPLEDIKQITDGYVKTRTKYYARGMDGTGDLPDQTLAFLRDEVMKLSVKSAKKRVKKSNKKAQKKYMNKEENKKRVLKTERDKYKYLRDLDYSRDEAKLWCKRSMIRIQTELLGGGS